MIAGVAISSAICFVGFSDFREKNSKYKSAFITASNIILVAILCFELVCYTNMAKMNAFCLDRGVESKTLNILFIGKLY